MAKDDILNKTSEITMTPEQIQKVVAAKAALQSVFGQAVLAMSSVARYRNQSLADLGHLVLDPLMRDRIAIATSKHEASNLKGALTPPAIAFWASVSDEVDSKIRSQLKSGVFPIRLKPEEWNCGEVVWLLDVIAPTRELATNVLSNFGAVAKCSSIKIHPMILELFDQDVLQRLLNSSAIDETQHQIERSQKAN